MQSSVPARGPSLADPLALLPADSDVVVTIDVTALRKSPLFTKHRAVVRDLAVPGFADCHYDPFDEIDTITGGIPFGPDLSVFVVRGLDRDRTLDCLRNSKIETETDAVFDGELVALRNKSGNTNLMKFVDAKTAVIQGSKGPSSETLSKALQIGAPLRKDQAFLAAERMLEPGAGIAMIGRPGSQKLSERLAEKLGVTTTGFAAAVYFTDIVTAHVVIEMTDASAAATIVEQMRPQLEALRQVVERYDIRAEERTVIADIAITEEQIKWFADLAKRTLGPGN